MNSATLYILSGLSGSGKTTIAELLARRMGAAHVRIDTIEQALRELCSIDVQGEGYRLGYPVTSDILNAGKSKLGSSSYAVFDATAGNANVSLEYGYAEAKNIPRVLYLSSHRAAHKNREMRRLGRSEKKRLLLRRPMKLSG